MISLYTHDTNPRGGLEMKGISDKEVSVPMVNEGRGCPSSNEEKGTL